MKRLVAAGFLMVFLGASCKEARPPVAETAPERIPKPTPSKYSEPKPPSPEALRGLVAKIQSVLPAGWHVKVRGHDRIEVVKDQVVEGLWGANLPVGAVGDKGYFEKNARFSDYWILLECRAPISVDDFYSMVEESRRAQAYQDQWKVRLNSIMHKFSEYLPRNAEERALLDEYEKDCRDLPNHWLPERWGQGVCVKFDHPWVEEIRPAEMAQSCREAQRLVESLFQAYTPEP